MAQTSSGMHVTASSSAPILAVREKSAKSTAAVTDTDSRSARRTTVVSGDRNGSECVGQLYQMVKVNVNGVIKNLMIPIESTKKAALAGTGDGAAKPGAEVSVSPDRSDAVSTPQPLVKPNSSNSKLVIVSQSRSLLGCSSRTLDQSSMSSSLSLSSPSSAGSNSVSSVLSGYVSPGLAPHSPPMSSLQSPGMSRVTRATNSIGNTPVSRHVIVGGDGLLATVVGVSNVMTTHVIQPVVGMNKHLVISGVQPVAGTATQTVATAAGVRFMTPVQLAGSEVAAPRPPVVVAQTVATSVAQLVAPQVRTVHVMSVPTAPGSPVRTPVAVGMPQPGAKQLVFTSTIPVLRPAQIANGTRIIQPTNTTNQPVLVSTTVRPTGTPVVGTLASQPVPAMQSPRQFFIHNPQVQKPGPILQSVVAGDSPRTVMLTVPVTGSGASQAVIVPRIIQPPKPRHAVVNGLPSIVPPQNTSPVLNVNQVRPMFTVVRSPSGGATVAPAMTCVTSVVPPPGRPALSVLNGVTGRATTNSQPKPLANTGSNNALSRHDSPNLKIRDVFSLQKGDSRIPSPLVRGAPEPVRRESGVKVPVAEPSTESPLPQRDPGVVVLASWNKDDYCSSDNANADSSDKTIGPSTWRKKLMANRRTTRVHRRTYGKFFQDAVASLTGCQVSLRPLELKGRKRVSAFKFEAERGKLSPRSANPLSRAAPRCFLDAADTRRGDSYTIDADGRSISAIFVTESVRLFCKSARQKRNKSTATSSPKKLSKTTVTTSASLSLAKNDAPKWVNQNVNVPTPIAPKVGANSVVDKKLRYLMVKTNAGTFLVPITSDGGLVNGSSTGTISPASGASRPVVERMVTRQTTTSGSATKDAVKVAAKDAAKVVSPATRTPERRTQYVMIPSQMSANYAADSHRSLLSPRIKSEPLKSGYEDAIDTSVPPKRFKTEFDIGSNDPPAFTLLPPPQSISGLSNQDRIAQLKVELKKQQEAVEALRRHRSDSLNVALSDTQ